MSSAADSVNSGRFLRFWIAQSLSQMGQRFGLLAVPVVAIETLDAGSDEVGYLTASLTVCYLLVGLPAGAWVDRWSKKSTMMTSAVVRAVALGAVPLLWAGGQLELEWMYAACAVVGVASVFFDVAYQSYVPFIVSGEAIEPANARLEASAQVSSAGGPALAGVILKVVSAPLVLAVDALAYVLCAGVLATVEDGEPRKRGGDTERSGLGKEILGGIRFVVRNPVLRRLCVSVGVSNFFATVVMTLTPLLILNELDLGATVMGVVLGIGALGGLAGSLLLPRIRRSLAAGVVMAAGLLLAAVSIAAFPAAGAFQTGGSVVPTGLVVLGQFGMTFGAVVFNITQVSVRQRVCPKDLLARMNASIRFVVWGSMPLAALLAGWMGSRIGIMACMWIGVAGGMLTVLPILGMGRLIRTEEQSTLAGLQNA
ncbi:MFS transporter [Streptomyces sp. WMMB 322]|uniref:MFS transporter n=1 Tax=Streptomyces sp. WMMB 322 TaxID=1286821 RepID=UPI0006E3620A|nr:MFS transporter [Streptomyces sp. WMMB 322]SCK13816.1 Predicted arabinose efflux permease, MFS family [Streptomyces sp. WMMB 322]